MGHVELLRLHVSPKLDPTCRAELGQFLTPAPIAKLMASMIHATGPCVRILDPGAGIGSLSAAVVAELCDRSTRPRQIHITAFELEPKFVEHLKVTLDGCRSLCARFGIDFTFDLQTRDFVRAAVDSLHGVGLFSDRRQGFTLAVLNPPYRKIRSDSETHRLLALVGNETTNLYAAFLWLTAGLLDPQADLVAITPRSFCNGPYFRRFRLAFLASMALRRIHLFERRDQAFADDEVLQENIIVHATKHGTRRHIVISSSDAVGGDIVRTREVPHEHIVADDDPNAFIHIVPDERDHHIAAQVQGLEATLGDLGLSVSTGRVVDFRATQFLRSARDSAGFPLIYPAHFSSGYVEWPNLKFKKPSTLAPEADGTALLVPAGHYVLTKRFSTKEEPKRIVAAIYDPRRIPADRVGFENHLNYYHQNGQGIPVVLAKGLAGFLNGSIVDQYFRQFSGHTQVNATDLRSLKYPSRARLESLGRKLGDSFPNQAELDNMVQEGLFGMAKRTRRESVRGRKLIKEALGILTSLNVPREQQNERSALALLALLDLRQGKAWKDAGDPLRGITEMMEYFREHFGKAYAPNTRETVRRYTIHQFVQIGLVVANPDDPARPVNSPDTRYQIESSALRLLRAHGTQVWKASLAAYLKSAGAMLRLHPIERPMREIPVFLPDGTPFKLSAGGQNVLVKDLIEKFCPRFTPGARLIYLGDASGKYRHFHEQELANLGVSVDEHGKMPDLVIHDTTRNWLILVEAVTTHGPVNLKRHNELKALFGNSTAGLVFVTAFLTRRALNKHLSDIAWETEVWIAESPSHLIHFNGERFLGPYSEVSQT